MAKITGKRRHNIRKSQIEVLFNALEKEIGESAALFRSPQGLELLETSTGLKVYLVDKKPQLIERDTWIFPTLKGLLEHPLPQRKVVVDMGAVPYVVNGADVMRPGIVSVSDDIIAGHPVQIVEERHNKPLALGIALFDAGEIVKKTQGKVIKTIHYVGDDLWNMEF